MNFSIEELNQLSDNAVNAVKLAGEYIKQFDRSKLKSNFKDSGSSLSSQVVTEVDLHCQEIIIKELLAYCDKYDIALLSEENCSQSPIKNHPRLSKNYFWCIDPLDGTLPFIEGRNGYAVSVALVNRAGKSILSAIYLPVTSDTFQIRFDKNAKAVVYKNGETFKPVTPKNNKTLNFYCDQSFLDSSKYPQMINVLTESLTKLELELINVISGHGAVVNALMVLENGPACYIKLPKAQQGGGALWDFSGTACITEAINGWVTDIHGHPLMLNQADSYYMNKNGIIFASDKVLGKALLEVIS